MKTWHNKILLFCLVMIIIGLVESCDSTKHIGKNEFLLTKNKIVTADEKADISELTPYIRQRPNTKWFSTLKVPLGIYSMAGKDTTNAINRRLKKWGEAPVILDTTQTYATCRNLSVMMHNRGWLDAEVTALTEIKNKRAEVTYIITPNQQYKLRKINTKISDSRIDSILKAKRIIEKEIRVGERFSINDLYSLRNNITTLLNNNGYYYFNKENITFICDTSKTDKTVNMTMLIGLYKRNSTNELTTHPQYTIRSSCPKIGVYVILRIVY